MTEAIKAPCELGLCNALKQDQLSKGVVDYIAKNCRRQIKEAVEHNPDYDVTVCPVAELAAAVIMRTEGDREIQELFGEIE